MGAELWAPPIDGEPFWAKVRVTQYVAGRVTGEGSEASPRPYTVRYLWRPTEARAAEGEDEEDEEEDWEVKDLDDCLIHPTWACRRAAVPASSCRKRPHGNRGRCVPGVGSKVQCEPGRNAERPTKRQKRTAHPMRQGA